MRACPGCVPRACTTSPPGAEFGWRSGWSVWPDYFYDSLPPTLNVGKGSPTGLVFYNHYKMPVRYHNAMFACDWAQGRILVVKFKPAARHVRSHQRSLPGRTAAERHGY